MVACHSLIKSGINFTGAMRPGELDSIKDAMSFAEDDLYLPGMFGRNEKYVKDPIGWIKDYLEAHKNHSM